MPVGLPSGVTITISGDNTVTVKGPKGTLSEQVKGDIEVTQENGSLIFTRP
ncbi:MAG: 50S ribosomal protein L6, partial [Clostridia bacterium]|nr:50S ribosomal protein L6 [Clostridia bacterium]